jgi:hypothetical protein
LCTSQPALRHAGSHHHPETELHAAVRTIVDGVAVVTLVIFHLGSFCLFIFCCTIHVCYVLVLARVIYLYLFDNVPNGAQKTPVCLSRPLYVPNKSKKESQKERKGKSISQLIIHKSTQNKIQKNHSPEKAAKKKATKKITPFSLDPQNATKSLKCRMMPKRRV